MDVANTRAAREYQSITKAVDWARLDLAHEVVAIEAVIGRMKAFRPGEEVFVFPPPGTPEKVGEVLERLQGRLMNKQHALLQQVGGKECDLRRATFEVLQSGFPALPQPQAS